MLKFHDLCKGVFFYINTLLKEKNITPNLVLKDTKCLFPLIKEDIENFDYSSIRVAIGRVIMMAYLDYSKIKDEDFMKFTGFAYDDIDYFYKSILEIINNNQEEISNFVVSFIDYTKDFVLKLKNSDLFKHPDKTFMPFLSEFLTKEELNSELFMELKKKNIKLKGILNEETYNVKGLLDFYSSLVTARFAFCLIEENDDLFKLLVECITKEITFCGLYEAVTTYKITNWILNHKF